MPTTANMGLVMPTEGGDSDIWDTILNTLFGLVDAHDHTTGKGVKVPSAGLKINADVSWSFSGTNYAITDAKAIDFTPLAATAMTSYSSALFANSSDSNNLYYRNSAGTNVKITDGSTLNVSIVGGIGGDYSSISALLDYDDATDTYRFRQETSAAVRQFAKLSSADVQLFEYKAAGDPTVPTNSVKLKSPAALAASYSVVFPAAVPAAKSAVQVSTAGVLTFSDVLTTWKFSTAIDYPMPASAWDDDGTHTRSASAVGAHNRWTLAASANKVWAPLRIPNGSIITGWSVYVDKETNGSATITARLYKTDWINSPGTETALGSGSSSSANAPTFIELAESGLSITIDNSQFEYYLVFTPSASVTPAADVLYGGRVTYKRDA